MRRSFFLPPPLLDSLPKCLFEHFLEDKKEKERGRVGIYAGLRRQEKGGKGRKSLEETIILAPSSLMTSPKVFLSFVIDAQLSG